MSAKKFLSIIIASLFLVMAALPVFAKNRGVDLSGRGSGYSAVLYDNSNGLPTSEANDIVQSEDGFIWIGGYSGLIRYDGNEFYRYDSSLGISSVVCLFIDSKKKLWIGTNDSGAACMTFDDILFFKKDNGLSSASIRDITEDKDGNIILATTLGVSYIDADGKVNTIKDERISGDYVTMAFTGEDGVTYCMTLDEDFFTIENLTVTKHYSNAELGLGAVKTVCPDPLNPGYVYFGTLESSVIHCKIGNGVEDKTVYNTEPLESINEVRYYEGGLWMASDNGVGMIDDEGRFTKLYDLPMTNSIDHVFQDYESNLWFTSSRQGVMKIVANRFIDISSLASLDPLIVNSTCMNGTDLYVATDTGLVVLNRNYSQIQNAATEYLEGVRIRCVKKDLDGNMWFCTYGKKGLVRYDRRDGTITSITEDDGLLSNKVRMMKVLSDGRLAVATNAGLNIVDNGKITESYSAAEGLSNLEILSIEETGDGALYLGSDGGGIYVIKDGKLHKTLGAENGLKSEVILKMKYDGTDDILWIITSNSISYLRDGKIKTLKTMPYANNFDMFVDKFDRAWVFSSSGINVVNRKDLLDDNVTTFTLFDKNYGLPGIMTANSHSYIDDYGVVYVASTTGVFSVDINKETSGGTDVKLSIPYISVDDKEIWLNGQDTVTIPGDCRRLNIYANAYTFSLINPHLTYKLEGFDDEEKVVTKQKMTYASYTNLSGGEYTFRISLVDDVTGQVEKEVTLKIVKERAIFENVWFMIIVIVLILAVIVALVYLYFRKKTKALLRKQEEDRKLINEMTRVFSGCIDMKDAYTNGHSSRVAKYTAMMAEKMGKTSAEVDEIYNIALLHDIGKIGIPDSILNKPGRLDNDEYAVMKGHAKLGHDILKEIEIDRNLALGAGYHHEKYDGTGYPSGLKGEEIPEVARIIAVADAFDAMYSTRPYRKKMELEDIKAEIKRVSGTQLDPKIVEVFLELADEGRFTDETIK